MAKEIPDWVPALSEAIAHTIEFSATASVGWLYEQPDEEGVHTILLYPEPMEIQEAGPNDGELIEPQVNSIDILEAQKKLDEVTSVILGFDPEGRTAISFEGQYQGQAVNVHLFLGSLPDSTEDEIQ